NRRECCRRPAFRRIGPPHRGILGTRGAKVLASFTISHEGRPAPRAGARRGVPAAARLGIPAPSPGGGTRLNLSAATARSIALRRRDRGAHRIGPGTRSLAGPFPIPSRRDPCYHGAARWPRVPGFLSGSHPPRRWPIRAPLFLKLAFAAILGGLILI